MSWFIYRNSPQRIRAVVINLLNCDFNRHVGIIPKTLDLKLKERRTRGRAERSLQLWRQAACCPKTQPDAPRRTDRQTVWCQLSPLSISRHHSSSCCYGQPTPPWQPTGCKSSVEGRTRKREFVCHAITFKRWWHVTKSLPVAPRSFFVSLLVTFSLFSRSTFTVHSPSSLPGCLLVFILSEILPICYLCIFFCILLKPPPCASSLFFCGINRCTASHCYVSDPWRGCPVPGPCLVLPHVHGWGGWPQARWGCAEHGGRSWSLYARQQRWS